MAQSLAQYQQIWIICNIFSKQTVNTAIVFDIFLQGYKTRWVKGGWYKSEYNMVHLVSFISFQLTSKKVLEIMLFPWKIE